MGNSASKKSYKENVTESNARQFNGNSLSKVPGITPPPRFSSKKNDQNAPLALEPSPNPDSSNTDRYVSNNIALDRDLLNRDYSSLVRKAKDLKTPVSDSNAPVVPARRTSKRESTRNESGVVFRNNKDRNKDRDSVTSSFNDYDSETEFNKLVQRKTNLIKNLSSLERETKKKESIIQEQERELKIQNMLIEDGTFVSESIKNVRKMIGDDRKEMGEELYSRVSKERFPSVVTKFDPSGFYELHPDFNKTASKQSLDETREPVELYFETSEDLVDATGKIYSSQKTVKYLGKSLMEGDMTPKLVYYRDSPIGRSPIYDSETNLNMSRLISDGSIVEVPNKPRSVPPKVYNHILGADEDIGSIIEKLKAEKLIDPNCSEIFLKKNDGSVRMADLKKYSSFTTRNIKAILPKEARVEKKPAAQFSEAKPPVAQVRKNSPDISSKQTGSNESSSEFVEIKPQFVNSLHTSPHVVEIKKVPHGNNSFMPIQRQNSAFSEIRPSPKEFVEIKPSNVEYVEIRPGKNSVSFDLNNEVYNLTKNGADFSQLDKISYDSGYVNVASVDEHVKDVNQQLEMLSRMRGDSASHSINTFLHQNADPGTMFVNTRFLNQIEGYGNSDVPTYIQIRNNNSVPMELREPYNGNSIKISDYIANYSAKPNIETGLSMQSKRY